MKSESVKGLSQSRSISNADIYAAYRVNASISPHHSNKLSGGGYLNVADIKNVEAEAGVIASILLKPELVFYSEQLRPNHFTDSNNAWIYYAVNELVKRGVEKMDVYNITNILNMREATKKATESITVKSLGELFDVAKLIARESVEDYQVLVRAVLDCAFRRSAFDKLTACQRLCCDSEESDIEQRIYCTLDDMMMEFSTTNDVPQYKDIVDQMWQEIKDRQGRDGVSGIPFKFPILNAYVTIESGELIIFGAEAKMGKSMMLLNCAADLLKRGLKVLYLDSELNTRLFTCRLISHLTGIEFSRVKSGRYTEDEEKKIEESIAWMKTRDFTHIYIPIFDTQSIYTTIKKVKHQMGIDVLIVDYFKSRGEGDAFASYQDLGRFVD